MRFTFVMKNRHPNLIRIGKIIRNARQEKGFSQEDFAAAAQLARTYFGRVERGEQNISVQNLIQIALTLQLEVGSLLPTLAELTHPYSKES